MKFGRREAPEPHQESLRTLQDQREALQAELGGSSARVDALVGVMARNEAMSAGGGVVRRLVYLHRRGEAAPLLEAAVKEQDRVLTGIDKNTAQMARTILANQ